MRFIINSIEYCCNLIMVNDGVLTVFKDDMLLLNITVSSLHSIIKKWGRVFLKNNGVVFDVMRTTLITTNLTDDVEEECFYDYLLDYIKEHKHELVLIN